MVMSWVSLTNLQFLIWEGRCGRKTSASSECQYQLVSFCKSLAGPLRRHDCFQLHPRSHRRLTRRYEVTVPASTEFRCGADRWPPKSTAAQFHPRALDLTM